MNILQYLKFNTRYNINNKYIQIKLFQILYINSNLNYIIFVTFQYL